MTEIPHLFVQIYFILVFLRKVALELYKSITDFKYH